MTLEGSESLKLSTHVHFTITIPSQHPSIFRMFVISVTEPVGGAGVPHVTYDWLPVRVSQNPLYSPILVVVAHQVLSKIKI